jgi:hypothetical protein
MIIFRAPFVGLVAAALLLLMALPLLAQDQMPAAPTVPETEQTREPPMAGAGAALPSGIGGSAFTVRDIEVDVTRKTAQLARIEAWREAARQAWPALWSRMTGNPAANAPELPDSAIEAMVGAIEIQKEQFSDTRYLATLGVIFDRRRAGTWLPSTARILQSRPMLLLPVLVDGGVRSVYESDSPWQRAWARFGTDSTPIDYVRAKGTAGDGVLLTSWQARRDNRELWRAILARYGAENVLVAEAHLDRSYPGGPIEGLFLARQGPDAKVLTRFRLHAGAAGELDAMLDEAVRRIDAAYATALQNGLLAADESLTIELAPIDASSPMLDAATGYAESRSLVANVVTPDANAWAFYDSALRTVPQVDSFSLVTLAIGGTSTIRINFGTDLDILRFALDQKGLRLEPGEGGMRLRRRLSSEPALPAPVTVMPAAEEGRPVAVPEEGGPADLLPDFNEETPTE